MRWGGAFVALFFCLAACLLVVALRIRTVQLRARLSALQSDASYLAAERARCERRLAWLQRTEVLQASSPAGERSKSRD
ncbi:MAG TPA: hypothetical protein PKE00_03050 [Planctomycetota bacterium]|nr:hypothetical protein [Planctomycetota bacterium]